MQALVPLRIADPGKPGQVCGLRNRRTRAIFWLLTALALAASLMSILAPRPARANGVPIRVPLTYLSGLSNWGPPEARGEAELSFSEALIRVDVQGLPALKNESYQLWLGKSGTNKATPAGSFTVAADGVGGYTGKLTSLDGYDYDLILLTVEPSPDADPAPTAKRSIGGFFTPIKKQESAGGVASDVQPAALPNTGDVPATVPAETSPRRKIAMMLFGIGGVSMFLAVRRAKRVNE
jgi:hypothetical protein